MVYQELKLLKGVGVLKSCSGDHRNNGEEQNLAKDVGVKIKPPDPFNGIALILIIYSKYS